MSQVNIDSKQKRFKNHFDEFPPILREMVMEATSEKDQKGKYGYYIVSPLHKAFWWDKNRSLSDVDFWNAVYEDAKYRKIWPKITWQAK